MPSEDTSNRLSPLARLDALATRHGRGATVLAAGLAFTAVMALMTWAVTAFHDAHGVGIFNLAGARNGAEPSSGGYTPDRAYEWLDAYGSTGRAQHLAILALDLPLITSVTIFAGLSLHLIARRLAPGRAGRVRRALLVLALSGGLVNLVEDAGITVLLLSYPTRLDTLARGLSAVNVVKSAAYSLTLLVAVIGLVAVAVVAIRARFHPPDPQMEL